MHTRTDAPDADATVTFVSERAQTTVRVALVDGRKQTLLSVAKQHRVPILFNCEAGGCAACIVRVTPLTVETAPVDYTDSEAFLLPATADMDEPDRGPACSDPAHLASEARLACQYVIGRGAIRVTFRNSLGSY